MLSRRVVCVGGVTISGSLWSSAAAQQGASPEARAEGFVMSLRGQLTMEAPRNLDAPVGRWGDAQGRLDELARSADRDVLLGLAGNFTNFRQSFVTQDAVRLPVAEIAYETLTSIVYHEQYDEEGDIVGDWAGYMSPFSLRRDGQLRLPSNIEGSVALTEALERARLSWTDALNANDFHYL